MVALFLLLGVGLPVGELIKAAEGINTHRAQSSERYISDQDATEILVKYELLPVTNYLPDVELIKQNGVKVFMAVGEWGPACKKWYVEVAQILAEKLGCERVTFPGHHGSFMDMPVEFAATLRDVLHKAE